MYKNFTNGNNEKISKVIELAINYKNHKKSIEKIKPALGMPTINSMKYVDKLTTNRIKYAEQSRHHKISYIQRQNQTHVRRVEQAASMYKKIRNPEISRTQRISSSQLSGLSKSKSKSRFQSRQSLHSCDSQRSISSNFQTRTRRYKQIQKQNKKLAKRITNPKIDKSMRIKQWDKSFAKQQQYIRIRSRFSQRSKSIMQSLTLDGLKMQKRNVQFLPQIFSGRQKGSVTECRDVRQKKMGTIGESKTSLQMRRQQSQKRMKTLQFAKHMHKQFRQARKYKQ